MGERVTTARAVELLVGATPGPWRESGDGTGHILAERNTPIVAATLSSMGWPTLHLLARNSPLVAAAPDLAADLIADRATIEALRADLAAARELRGVVTAAVHARAVREAWWSPQFGTHADVTWGASSTRRDLIATLTRSGIPESEAVKAADGDQ